MTKIPVGATIAQAYRFAFAGIVNLIRVSWLPLAGIIIVMFAIVLPALSNLMDALSGQGAGTSGAAFLRLLPAYLVMMLLFFVQIAAIAQSALGLPQSAGWLVFPFGKPLWRLIGAFLIFLLILVAISILLGVVMGLVIVAIGGNAAGAGHVVLIGLAVRLLAYALLAFLFVRLGFLLTPAAVEGPGLGLVRSWKLSRGRFWRLFAILLAVTLPFVVLEVAVLVWFVPHMPMPVAGPDAAQYQATVLEWESALFARLQSHWPVTATLWGLATLILYGLLVGAQCFAYRRVTEGGAAD